MDERHVFIENVTGINKVITQTFQTTNRIKLTCFDVSKNYIIYGASSGGIYIFNKNPCEFVKLIPSKEGSAVLISISPNEKHVALASSKGLIIILEDCFSDINFKFQVYSEHEGQIITSLIWQNNSLYCGDSSGKITVISMMNLLTKAIFQNAVASIMTLDSPIVQLDSWEKYLLVSTNNRTYLCDTEKEQFKQIGKKNRDGPFGACFLNSSIKTISNPYVTTTKNSFKTIHENDSFAPSENTLGTKIYCARPGVRLWEANFEAAVVFTHQIRASLKQKPTDIIILEDDVKAKLSFKIVGSELDEEVPDSFNFGKIFSICDKFILTFHEDGLYVFDPSISSLVFWTHAFRNIRDVKVLNSTLYVWRKKQLDIISLLSLENLILKTLLDKQYFICSELCIKYSEDVLNLVPASEKLHLITILKQKLIELDESSLLEQILPLLEKIKILSKQQKVVTRKLGNGITLIENNHFNGSTSESNDVYLPESILNFKGIGAIKEKLQILENTVKNLTFDVDSNTNTNKTKESLNIIEKQNCDNVPILQDLNHPSNVQEIEIIDDLQYRIKVLLEQYKLNKIHAFVETTKVTRLLQSVNLQELYELFLEFIKEVNHLEKEDPSDWCKEQYLQYIVKTKQNEINNLTTDLNEYLINAFIDINDCSKLICECNFPLPKAKDFKPKYYDVGLKLLENTENFTKLTNKVPYMWRHYLANLTKENILENLPLIIQFSDVNIIENLLNSFHYDYWDEAIKFYVKLQENKCLNCSAKIDNTGLLTWNQFSLFIVQSTGAINTMKLLKRYSKYIPNGELESNFYQSCMFSTTINNCKSNLQNRALELSQQFQTNIETEVMLKKSMERYLTKEYVNSNEITSLSSNKCTYCDMPINIPILNDTVNLDCGHNYHKMCFVYNKNLCTFCQSV